MTRIGHQNLTAANRTGTISYDRTLEFLVLYNNNPVPLYVRLGSPEIPNEFNYDISVPPNYIMAISVNSQQFGFRLGSASVVTTLITGISVVEATIDEQPPSLGGVPINNASLSTADLLNGVPLFNGPTLYGPFNINQWGGLIINVIPSATSGQGVIQIDVSADGTTWIPYQTWAFWQNIPATILTPRVSQFARITLNATAIIGEPAIAGNVSIRGSLAEITTPSYTPQGTSIVKTYALAASGSAQYQFVTTGIPAVSIAAIATAGTGASAAITLLIEASSDLINWRQVTFRTQRMSTGITLYRAVGKLDLFMRVTIFEVGGISAANGSVYLSIPDTADTGAILNTIQQSLGDIGAPTNTNQDVYHELDNVRLNIGITNTTLGTTNTNLSTINSNIVVLLGTSGFLYPALISISTTIGSTNTLLGTTNTLLGTINTNIGSTNTLLTNINSLTNTTNTNIATILASQSRSSYMVTGSFVYNSAGAAFLNAGFLLVQGSWIESCVLSVAGAAASFATFAFLEAAYGTAGAPVAPSFYRCSPTLSAVTFAGTASFQGSGEMVKYDSLRSPGLVIPSGNQILWIRTGGTAAAISIDYTIVLVV